MASNCLGGLAPAAVGGGGLLRRAGLPCLLLCAPRVPPGSPRGHPGSVAICREAGGRGWICKQISTCFALPGSKSQAAFASQKQGQAGKRQAPPHCAHCHSPLCQAKEAKANAQRPTRFRASLFASAPRFRYRSCPCARPVALCSLARWRCFAFLAGPASRINQ